MPPLTALVNAGYNVVAVYSQPDRRAGRGRKLSMSPVKEKALEHNLKVEQPQSLRDAEQQLLLKSYQPDLMVVAAYGQILPIEVLTTPTHGCFNIHASLLPRWRGAAPIQRAIEHGDKKSGVTIMQMDVGLDTGDMLHKVECDIGTNTTGAQLHDQLATLGTDALMHTLEQLHAQKLSPEVQDNSQSCYAHKIEKAEALLDWNQSAEELHRKVCAFNAWPVAQTVLNNEVIRIWESSLPETVTTAKASEIIAVNDCIDVATGNGTLRIHTVQPPGKKAMKVADFLNSRSITSGVCFG